MDDWRGSMGVDFWDLVDADADEQRTVGSAQGDYYCKGAPMGRSVMSSFVSLLPASSSNCCPTHGKVTSKTALRQGSGAVQ
jgi:hypothetical protein